MHSPAFPAAAGRTGDGSPVARWGARFGIDHPGRAAGLRNRPALLAAQAEVPLEVLHIIRVYYRIIR
jgi:hypothetical protein